MALAPSRRDAMQRCNGNIYEGENREKPGLKYWELIAEKLSASGLSWGCSSEIDGASRVLYTADAYRKDGKRFTVIADNELTAFLDFTVIFYGRTNFFCKTMQISGLAVS
jgi:hypothetical protein